MKKASIMQDIHIFKPEMLKQCVHIVLLRLIQGHVRIHKGNILIFTMIK